MNTILQTINETVYQPCLLALRDFVMEDEGQEYCACHFTLSTSDGKCKIICRNAKIIPKKLGQFVTFWHRDLHSITAPYNDTDDFDYYVVNVGTEQRLGQFVFPKSVLVKHGIVSTERKEGKRGFRVYPSWVTVQNKQAEKTQKWQCAYFYELNNQTNFENVLELYQKTPQ